MTSGEHITFTSEQLREKYDSFAPTYDRVEGINDRILRVRRLRRTLFQRASGSVLEVAAGTGRNFPFYPERCEITAVDVSPGMLALARDRADRLGLTVSLQVMDAETLGFPDGSFDTVVSSLSTCTLPHPIAALHEMARVCRPGGRILLLEHGRSSVGWIGRLQDRLADRQARAFGCHWTREPLQMARAAGLEVRDARRTLFGVFHAIEAVPGPVDPRGEPTGS